MYDGTMIRAGEGATLTSPVSLEDRLDGLTIIALRRICGERGLSHAHRPKDRLVWKIADHMLACGEEDAMEDYEERYASARGSTY